MELFKIQICIPEAYNQLIQDMYEGTATHVRCMNGCSEPFAVAVGVHQRSALSPFLLTIIMDYRMENKRKDACG